MSYLTTEQVAELAHCSIYLVREAVKRGELRAYNPARKYLFTKEDVESWIASHIVTNEKVE